MTPTEWDEVIDLAEALAAAGDWEQGHIAGPWDDDRPLHVED